jgi:hypothetical protein
VWNLTHKPAGCSACEQAFLVPAELLGKPCPNCVRGTLEEQPAILTEQPPELLVPFVQSRQSLLPILQEFTKPVWLRTGDFTPENLLQRATAGLLPDVDGGQHHNRRLAG